MASDRFIESIAANIAYWRGRVDETGDPAARELMPEEDNIYRAIEFGLALKGTCEEATKLILDLHYYIRHGGNWRPWQRLLQQSLAQCDCNDELKRRLMSHAGQYYRHDRKWNEALAAHTEEERLALDLGKKDILAQAYSHLGSVYWRMRNYGESERYGKMALAIFREVEATARDLGGVLTMLGLVAYGRGQYEKAVELHRQASEHFRAAEMDVLLARSLVNLGLAHGEAGDIEGALAAYDEARSMLAETDYRMDKARVDLSMGTLFFNNDRLEEAEEAWLRAYSPFLKRSALTYLQGLATNNLGNVYLAQGRLGDAEAILLESLAIWERANAPIQAANTQGTLAKVFVEQGRKREALVYYRQAIQGMEMCPDDDWAGQLLAEFREEETALLRGN